jgi:hypothetical protein
MKFVQITLAQTTYGKTLYGLTDTGRIFEQADVPSANRTGPKWSEVRLPNMDRSDITEERPRLSRDREDAIQYSLVWLYRQIESGAKIQFNRDSVLHVRVKKALGLED